jgi:protease I
MSGIKTARILIIATDGFEQSELEVPRDALREAGACVDVASPNGKEIRGWEHTDWGKFAPVDLKISEVDADKYAALVIPGGVMNPDKLRVEEDAMRVVRAFLDSGKIIAAVCHGPWLLVQADALRNRQATSYNSIRMDLENAGAIWVDKEVVTDGNIITSRNPGDLQAFAAEIIKGISERAAKTYDHAAE